MPERAVDPKRASSWITVHVGPPWEVEMLGGMLEQAGFPVFLPDRATKSVDPFITGFAPLSSRLQVPSGEVEAAQEVLRRARARARADASREADAKDGASDEGEPTAEEELSFLATRTRWAALLGVTSPFAVFYGVLYLIACRKHGIRDRRHGLTLAGLALGSFLVTVGLALVVYRAAGALHPAGYRTPDADHAPLWPGAPR